MDYINSAAGPVTKRDIARAFHVRGPDKVHLKKILRELANDGAITRDTGRSVRPADRLPSVMVIKVVRLTDDGEAVAHPADWPEAVGKPAPTIYFAKARGRSKDRAYTPSIGEQCLARLDQIEDEPPVYLAHIIKMLRDAPDTVLGVFRGTPNGGRIHPTSKKLREEFLVDPEDVKNARDGELVLARPKIRKGKRTNGPTFAVIEERVGDIMSPGAISMIAIHAHDIPHTFPQEVLDAADAMQPAPLKGREDLRNIPLITIDPADARDHDDAIFAEPDTDPNNPGGWHLIVAIADVSWFVRAHSPMDKEALKRSNSCYFPDRVVPMLPEALSAGLCSLQPGKERAALVAHIWIDKDGQKLRHTFTRALMRSHANINYSAAQQALDGMADASTAPFVEPVLKPLYKAWLALSKARDMRAPLDLDIAEQKIELDETGHIKAIIQRERLDTHRIVEDFMISANVAAAEALEDARTPLIYRVHEEPSMDKLESLRDFLASLDLSLARGTVMRPGLFNGILKRVHGKPEEQLVNDVVLRSQMQAYYTSENMGHFGLALPRYAHFTSPIRRYADLIVHRALVKACKLGDGGLDDTQISTLDDIAEHISQSERRAMKAERESNDRYLALYLANQVGKDFVGRISGVSRFGLFVTLEPSGGDGLIPISDLGDDFYRYEEKEHALIGNRKGRIFRLGDKLDVSLREANVYTGGLRLSLVGTDDGNRGRRGLKGFKGFKGAKDTRGRTRGKPVTTGRPHIRGRQQAGDDIPLRASDTPDRKADGRETSREDTRPNASKGPKGNAGRAARHARARTHAENASAPTPKTDKQKRKSSSRKKKPGRAR